MNRSTFLFQSTGSMGHTQIFCLLLFVLASLTPSLNAEHEEAMTNASSIVGQVGQQVGQVIPEVFGDVSNTASNAATMLLPEILESAYPAANQQPQVCNTTAFMINLDACMTPDRVANWIKIAKPFIRLMSKAEVPRKKNNRN